jgi:uncharacterized protein YegP (UPF0339 family)
MREQITIQKNPVLADSQNYALLRAKGLEYIQQLGSQLWTDYNTHDPGITLLELLSYAITDLGNRTSFDIKDILAEPLLDKSGEKAQHDRQGFFTARDILTVNPWTINDFRKLLIDVEGVRNAWLYVKQCPCDGLYLYANCKTSELQYEYTEHEVVIKGFYDVLIECEDDEEGGNLNSGKINYNFSFTRIDDQALSNGVLEMRLPSWQGLEANLGYYQPFINPGSVVETVTVLFISGNKEDDKDIAENKLGDALRRPLFVTMDVVYKTSETAKKTEKIRLTDVPFRIWFHGDRDRKNILLKNIKDIIEDATRGGSIPKYLAKVQTLQKVLAQTRQSLHSHRNLCEDFCSITTVQTEDFAVCADVEVEPFADIEAIMAEAFYQIDEYMRPEIRFYSLQQMLAAGNTMDQIFEGPRLNNGFIDDAQLNSTGLRTVLFTSDIVNLLMDIPGVKAVRNLTLVSYDDEGNLVESDPWSLKVTFRRQPGLYVAGSKFLVYKDGLPFLPDRFELNDTLQVIKGRNAQPKFSLIEMDVAVPNGTHYDLAAYQPLQYALPLTYGVGYDGLPNSATPQRKAQAQQLKAYLLFYEQLLVNYLGQLTHVKELFALDPTVDKTYFTQRLTNAHINGIESLYNGLGDAELQALGENETLLLNRRNRFLDHQMARFAEQFTDYALMLYAHVGNNTIAGDKLIKNKIEFLKDYPFMSRNRGRSFNYKDPGHVCSSDNIAGLQNRLQRLLGFRQLLNYYSIQENKDSEGNIIGRQWVITNQLGKKYLLSPVPDTSGTLLASINVLEAQIKDLQDYISLPTAYSVVKKAGKWQVQITNGSGKLLALGYHTFDTKEKAEEHAASVQRFGSDVANAEKIYVVEHILLRPRNSFSGFEMYEEKDEDNRKNERRWRLRDENGKVILSASTRYYEADSFALGEQKALAEIAEVCKYILIEESYRIFKGNDGKFYFSLLNDKGEVIATRKQGFKKRTVPAKAAKATKAKTEESAEEAMKKLIAFAKGIFKARDPLLPVCIPPNCDACGEEDPYSFRMTVVLNGELGMMNEDIVFRRFAEKTIREEVPAHIGVKICWISTKQFAGAPATKDAEAFVGFEERYCKWLALLANDNASPYDRSAAFAELMELFVKLKNVYPVAKLHDCVDGNDDNRVLLGQTVIVDHNTLHTK